MEWKEEKQDRRKLKEVVSMKTKEVEGNEKEN